MFTRIIRRGLANRLANNGMNPHLALIVAEANYPGGDMTDPELVRGWLVVGKHAARRYTEQHIDQRTLSETGLMRLFPDEGVGRPGASVRR